MTLISIAGLITGFTLQPPHLIICTNKCTSDTRRRRGKSARQEETEGEGKKKGSRERREKTIGRARCFLFPQN